MTLGKCSIEDIWCSVLGEMARPNVGFVDNGGDSFQAVVLAGKVFEEFGVELDFLDVIEATSADDLREKIRRAAPSGEDARHGA